MYKKKYELTYQDLINQVRKYDKLTVEKKQYEEQTKTQKEQFIEQIETLGEQLYVEKETKENWIKRYE